MATLYDLSAEYADLAIRLEEAETEEEAEAIWEELECKADDITTKAENFARYMKNKQAEAKSLEAEIERLTTKKKAAENLAERLKKFVEASMNTLGIDKLQTNIGKFYMQKNPMSVEIIDESKVPEVFKSYEVKISKSEILAQHKATDELIDGCEFKQTTSIRFR